MNENLCDLAKRQTKIDIDQGERIFWHVGGHRFVRILHYGDAAARFDREQPGRAVITAAAEHDTNNFFAMRTRGAAKQNIGRRPVPIFARTAIQQRDMIFNRQVAMRRGAVNPSALISMVIFGEN